MEDFVPQTFDFYACFEQISQKVLAASQEMTRLFSQPADRAAGAAKIRGLEQEADQIKHAALERLTRSFVLPFDREDMHQLITCLDDILDMINGGARRCLAYQPKIVPTYVVEMAQILEEACAKVNDAMKGIRDWKRREQVVKRCVEINRIENLADEKLQTSLAALFSTPPDPIELIKIKELLEDLERATDSCEDVSSLLQGIVFKQND